MIYHGIRLHLRRGSLGGRPIRRMLGLWLVMLAALVGGWACQQVKEFDFENTEI